MTQQKSSSLTTGEPIPPSISISKAAGSVRNYLEQFGETRGILELGGTDNKQLPQASVPAYIHLAISQIASHPALPYGGNVAAFVRDAVYILLMAYADTLDQFDLSSDESKLAEHVIRREEAMRRDVLVETIGLAQIADLAPLAQIIDLARVAGDKDKIYETLKMLFHHVDRLPTNTWRHQLLLFIAGVPEFRDALATLNNDFKYRFDDLVQGWVSRIEEIDNDRTNK